MAAAGEVIDEGREREGLTELLRVLGPQQGIRQRLSQSRSGAGGGVGARSGTAPSFTTHTIPRLQEEEGIKVM